MSNKLKAVSDYSRRKFLLSGTATLGIAALMRPTTRASMLRPWQLAEMSRPTAPAPLNYLHELSHLPKPAKDKVLHVIGYSHIDAAWLWPWRDGSNIVLTTFRSALDRMKETPGFKYSHSSAIHYQWVQRSYPKMFEEIKERVREGRLEVVGGWPVEPDCNIPSTESFVRHCLYGKEFCQRELGVDVNIGFNADSFGHAAGLPAILKAAGYRYYVFMRPQDHEMKLPLLFWWEAPDGSRVLTLRIRRSYDNSPLRIAEAAQNNFAPGFNNAAFFLGVGDHGGAVTRDYIKQVLEMQNDPQLPELRWSTLREFFSAVEQSPAFSELPVVRTELQHHARGCYSAYGEGKQLNHKAERSLGHAETLSMIANLDHNHLYPADDYRKAWWKVLFNQFHDVMAGTTLYVDYKDTRDSLGWACETAQTSKLEALESLAKRVDTSTVKEGAVFLFNPLPWPRRTLVEYHTENNPNSDPVPITYLETRDKQKLSLQWRPNESISEMNRLVALVDLPACGYKVVELAHGTAPDPTSYLDFVTVSDHGFGVSSLRTSDGKELLAAPIGLVVISDTSDTWSHGIAKFRQEIGRPSFTSADVIEDGSVLRLTRHRAKWNNSDIVLDITQYRGMEAIELRFVIDWHEREQILKLEVPLALASPRVFAKVPGAAIERQTNGEEEPYQDWVAVQGKLGNEDYTVGLINDSTYSYDCLNGLLRTILIRSAPFARHDPRTVPHNTISAWQDQGRQERRFWLVRGNGPFTALELDRLAEEMQTPAEYVIDSAHEGTELWERSFISVTPSSVWVTAIKRSEREDGFVIRLQERAGKPTQSSIEIPTLSTNHQITMRPWEIKTLLLGRKKDVREVSLLET
jgi:alpha-mannosidase